MTKTPLAALAASSLALVSALAQGGPPSRMIVDLWAYHHKVRMDFSRPATPTDNAHIESFNGSLRDECLNIHWFETLPEARKIIEAWRKDYNECRSHMALDGLPPAEYALRARTSCGTEGLSAVGN